MGLKDIVLISKRLKAQMEKNLPFIISQIDSIIINKFVPSVSMWIWWFGCPLNGLLYQAGNLNEMNYGHAFIVLPQNNPDRKVYSFNANAKTQPPYGEFA